MKSDLVDQEESFLVAQLIEGHVVSLQVFPEPAGFWC